MGSFRSDQAGEPHGLNCVFKKVVK